MAAEIGIWAVPLTAFVSFTLYGIEGIAQSYEDPFGRVLKTDINVDDIVEDARQEVEVLLFAWQTQGKSGDDGLFRGRSMKSRVGSEVASGAGSPRGGEREGHIRFVVNQERFRDEVSADRGRGRMGSAVSPGERGLGGNGKATLSEEYFGTSSGVGGV